MKGPHQPGWTLGELAARHWKALSLNLQLKDRPISARHSLALFTLHLFGLLAIVRLTHQPFWLVWAVVLFVQPLVVSLRVKRLSLFPECFAPLGLAYGVLILRLTMAVVARAYGLTTGSLTVPEPWGGLLDLNIATALSGLWVLQAQAGLMAEALGKPVWEGMFGCVLALLTVVWSAVTYTTLATKGVTASDPYAYAQMAVDIVRHGLPLHTFDLAPRVAEWGLPVWPVVPVGYSLPDLKTGVAATVWPPGHSALLAIGYVLAGETGLYVLTPVLGLVALVAMGWLCLEVLHAWPNHQRFLAAGTAVFVLATSRQQIERLVVPMADVPSQLFTILTIYFALRARRGPLPWFACLSGLCLGAAFAIRYTQVLLIFSVFLGFLLCCQDRPRPWRALILAMVCLGATAWLIALPVLWYHQIAFGNPFSVGSAELKLFGWEHIPKTFIAVTKDLLRTNEFLYLLPFLGWGAIRLWRSFRRAAYVLLCWLMVLVLFHLPYAALRTRDLLMVFPVLALWVGVGVADALSQIQRMDRPTWRGGMQVLVFFLVIASLWARTRFTFQLDATNFNPFGYLRLEQRAAFDVLSGLTPPEAVVTASLNSGSIELYANRDTVRPAYWSESEWLGFMTHALSEGRPVYLLIDGVEMQKPFQIAQSHYRLTRIAFLPMPYYQPDGTSDNLQVPLYRVRFTAP